MQIVLKILLATYLLLTTALSAQLIPATIYADDSGLLSHVVLDFEQDDLGRMWFATKNGISIYDDFEWKTLDDSTHSRYIFNRLEKDDQGIIWGAEESDRLAINGFYNGKILYSFKNNFNENKPFYINDFEVINRDNSIRILIADSEDNLYYYNNGTWSKPGLIKPANSPKIYALQSYKDGYWVCTSDNIYNVDFNGKITESRFSDLLPQGKIFNILYQNNRLFVLSNKYLGVIENGVFTYLEKFSDLKFHSEQFYTNLELYGKKLLFQSYNGLVIFDIQTKEKHIFNQRNGLLSSVVYGVYPDRERNIWVSTSRGVVKLPGLAFINEHPSKSVRYDDITSLEKLPNGEIVLGQYNAYAVYNGSIYNIKQLIKTNLLYRNRILDLELGPQGNVWFAAWEYGIGKINKRNFGFERKYPEIGTSVSSIESFKNNLLIAAHGGLYYTNGNWANKVYHYPDTAEIIRKILVFDNKGIFLCSDRYGIRVLNNKFKEIQNITEEDSKHCSTYSINIFKGDTLVGTRNGLKFIKNGKLVNYPLGKQNIQIPVYFINEHSSGLLVIGSADGIFLWDGNTIRHLNDEDGMLGADVNRDAYLEDDKGRIWIGTPKGLSIYNLAPSLNTVAKPKLIIENAYANGDLVDPNYGIEVLTETNSLLFRLKDISFVIDRDRRYEVLLEGFDKKWRKVTREKLTSVNYDNVPSGEYKLKVKRTNLYNDDIEIIESGIIRIHPDFYRSYTFRVLMITGMAVILVMFILYFRKNRSVSRLQHEAEEHARRYRESILWNKILFESSSTPILILEKEGLKISFANNGTLDLFKTTKESIIGLRINELIPDYPENFNKERIAIHETELVETTGTKKNLEVLTSFMSTGEAEYLFVRILDITKRKVAEQELQKSEEQYRKLVTNIQDGIFLLQDGKIIYSNKALTQMLGLKSGELAGKPFTEYISEEDREFAVERHNKRLQGINTEEEYFLTLIDTNGEKVYTNIHVSLTEYNGKLAVLGTAKNVTQRLKHEEELKVLSTVVEQSPVSIIITDTDFAITYVNPTFIATNGYSPREVMGRNINIIRYEQTEIDKLGKGILLQKKVWFGEFKNITMDGEQYWVSCAISPIRNSDNQITGYVFIENDISFEKQSREEIQKNEKLLTSVVNNLPVVVFLIDKNGFVKFAKGSGLEELNLKEETLNGINIDKLKNIFEGAEEDFEKALNGFSFRKERRIASSSFEITYSALHDTSGEFVGFVAVTYDITERQQSEERLIKAKEEAENTARLKSEFLAQISHEIRTPINSMMSFASLIKDDVNEYLSEDLMEGFEVIDRGGRRLIRTVDLILNMSEVQAKSYSPNYEVLNLYADVFQRLILETEHLINKSKVNFQFSSNVKESVISADRHSLHEIFTNLIDNAIKYTEEGSIKIILTEEKDKIHVLISDTGIGMSEEFLHNIYEPFSQEETGYTRRYEGNGLGMALVNEYVKINNASISISSKKGEGTTVKVSFNKIS